ncbi:hypothetical protein AHF37_11836 [Paragonimus kellicotti]|nr:hypothetical protein AHF37_11836 [Paragonimus kellicotti]
MSKKHQTVGLVDDWFGFLWSEQNERSDSTLVKFGSRLPLTTGLMMLFTCLMSSPNELYRVGVQLIYLLVSYVIASVIVVELFLPVLNKHKIFSVNQYLDARFGRSVRILSALIHLFHLVSQLNLTHLSS